MLRYALRRILWAIPALIGISLVVFLISTLIPDVGPGTLAARMALLANDPAALDGDGEAPVAEILAAGAWRGSRELDAGLKAVAGWNAHGYLAKGKGILQMMDLGPGERSVAAVDGAGVVEGGQGQTLRLGEQPAGATQVEGERPVPRTAGTIAAPQARRRADLGRVPFGEGRPRATLLAQRFCVRVVGRGHEFRAATTASGRRCRASRCGSPSQ